MPLHANSRKVIIMNAVEITIIIVAAVLLLCGILFGVVSYLVFYEVIARNSKIPGKIDANAKKKMMETNPEKFLLDPREEWLNNQTFENYSITNVDGNKLKGYLLKADKPSDVYVFGSHGYRCWGKREFRLMAKFYHDLGFNVFIVDHQAHGESEGKYIGFGSHESRDAMQWLRFMTDTFGSDIQIILHGVSMGCATVMMMSGNPDLPKNVKFTVADCGYTSPWAEFDYQLKNAHVPTSPLLDGANFFNKHIAKYDFKKVDAVESVSHAQVPMLFIHGTKDDFVPTYMVHELYDACSTDKDLLLVEGAGHAESYPTDSAAYGQKSRALSTSISPSSPKLEKNSKYFPCPLVRAGIFSLRKLHNRQIPFQQKSAPDPLLQVGSISLFLLFWLRCGQLVIHRLKELFQKLSVLDVFNHQHRFSAVIRQLLRCVRHHISRRLNGLYEKSVVVYPADYFSAKIEYVFAHHCPARHIAGFAQLFECIFEIIFA